MAPRTLVRVRFLLAVERNASSPVAPLAWRPGDVADAEIVGSTAIVHAPRHEEGPRGRPTVFLVPLALGVHVELAPAAPPREARGSLDAWGQ